MTVTIEEAKTNLASILVQAQAGEEVLIGPDVLHPVAKLVPLKATSTRLPRHPDLAGSTRTLDTTALLNPLPPEEWGALAT